MLRGDIRILILNHLTDCMVPSHTPHLAAMANVTVQLGSSLIEPQRLDPAGAHDKHNTAVNVEKAFTASPCNLWLFYCYSFWAAGNYLAKQASKESRPHRHLSPHAQRRAVNKV